MVHRHRGSLYTRFGYSVEASSGSAPRPIWQGSMYDRMWWEIQWGESILTWPESLFRVSILHIGILMILIIYYRCKPGDIVILRSPYLFHAISRWMPEPLVPGDKCTPGRVSWVHFTYASVHDQLERGPKNWPSKYPMQLRMGQSWCRFGRYVQSNWLPFWICPLPWALLVLAPIICAVAMLLSVVWSSHNNPSPYIFFSSMWAFVISLFFESMSQHLLHCFLVSFQWAFFFFFIQAGRVALASLLTKRGNFVGLMRQVSSYVQVQSEISLVDVSKKWQMKIYIYIYLHYEWRDLCSKAWRVEAISTHWGVIDTLFNKFAQGDNFVISLPLCYFICIEITVLHTIGYLEMQKWVAFYWSRDE